MPILIDLPLIRSLWFLVKWLEILDLIEVRNAQCCGGSRIPTALRNGLCFSKRFLTPSPGPERYEQWLEGRMLGIWMFALHETVENEVMVSEFWV